MRTHALLPAIVAAAALAACAPYVNAQFFLYSVDTWTPEGQQVVHRRFVDDVDFPGVPEDEPRVTYGHFLQLAVDEGATRRAIACDGASLVVRDSEVPWSHFWTGELELWAETESGHSQQLGAATIVDGVEMKESLAFAVQAIDLMEVSDDFETGAFDIVLRGTPAGPLDELPPLELLVSFESEAYRPVL